MPFVLALSACFMILSPLNALFLLAHSWLNPFGGIFSPSAIFAMSNSSICSAFPDAILAFYTRAQCNAPKKTSFHFFGSSMKNTLILSIIYCIRIVGKQKTDPSIEQYRSYCWSIIFSIAEHHTLLCTRLHAHKVHEDTKGGRLFVDFLCFCFALLCFFFSFYT